MSAMVDNNNYNFTSKPRPIRKGQRTTAGLFTENAQDSMPPNADPEMVDEVNQSTPYANIMYDRRIVRGNTYAQAGTVMRKNRFGGHVFDIQHDQNATSPVLAPKKKTKKHADS